MSTVEIPTSIWSRLGHQLPSAAAISGLLLMIVLLLKNFVEWAMNMARAIAAPYQLDYGEGIVWQQAKMIMSGNAYGDINQVPHIVFHYPPVFHVTASLVLSMLDMDGLAAGRLVSAVSCAGASTAVGYLVWQSAPSSTNQAARLISSVCASLLPIAFMPIAYWSALYRVDNLAIFLTMLGLCFGTKAIGNRICLVLSALFFVLALFTKQTMIAAPLACFVVTYISDRRTALAGLGTGVLFGLPLLVGLMVQTDGGFLRHIAGYNINRIDIANLADILHVLKYHAIFVCIPMIWLVLKLATTLAQGHPPVVYSATEPLTRADTGLSAVSLSIAYMTATTLTLPAVLKSGASYSYLIEWMYALVLGLAHLLNLAVTQTVEALRRKGTYEFETGLGKAPLFRHTSVAVFLAFAVQIVMASPQSALFRKIDEKWLMEYELLRSLVASADRPIISDEMVVLVLAGKQVYLEPAIVAELASLGKFDESDLLQKMAQRHFAFIITQGKDDGAFFLARYTPAARLAILTNYPSETQLAGFTIHKPQP